MLKALEEEDLQELLERALRSPKGFGSQNVQITREQIRIIARFANGDAGPPSIPWKWPC